jgi:lipopolysaccharide transport system permease protein
MLGSVEIDSERRAASDSRRRPEIRLTSDVRWFALDPRTIWEYRDLLSLLVWRDVVAKYKQTVLGPLWFVVQPLLMTLVFTVIFGNVAKLSTDGLPPLLFYLCGQLSWNYFSQNVTTNSGTLVNNASLFSKVYFPRLVVPLATLISNVIAFAIQAATFSLFFLYYKFVLKTPGLAMSKYALLLPLLVVHMALLSLGISLLLSAAAVKYRDLAQLTGLLIQIWMYATPVIYPLSAVPVKWRWLAALNPMTPVVEAFRVMLLGTGSVTGFSIACSVGVTAGLLLSGLLVFARIERNFVDVV